jgi:CRISPR-associated protein Cmr6
MAEPLKLRSGKMLVPAQSPGSNPSSENAKQSPLWLKGYEPSIATDKHTFVGFAEYLRWMRSPDKAEKDKTKLEILQLAAEKSDSYKQRLAVLASRTKCIAGEENTFEVTSTWRIRVGGQRGPESMLLPAWDALGIPYIPSSTLRGVARDRAIREFMENGMNYDQATAAITPYFGSIDASTPKEHRMGKVVFLDAYPVPSSSGALAVDLANNIWKWEGNLPKYGASPFPLLSLVKPTFTIGIKPTQKCDAEIFNKIKGWLIAGLQAGIGSQVNSGYGELLEADSVNNTQKEILRTNFMLEGQLIHGVQKIIPGQKYPQSQAEIRPIAFRAMLRYWFRAFALGVLPNDKVQNWEAKLFGSIDSSPTHGWISVHIIEKECKPSLPDVSGKQSGTLILRYSNSAPLDLHDSIYKLCRHLTWLMFNLGGVGQGARRPLHQRSSFPRCRGSRLQIVDKQSQAISFEENQFRKSFRELYLALGNLVFGKNSEQQINYQSPLKLSVSQGSFAEVIDANCCILICKGESNTNKPYALNILHSQESKSSAEYEKLCGKMQKPSPVWICDKGKYQVVTVFGANTNPRKKYVEKLLADQNNVQVFPI